jgi:hypothetical protein
MKNTFNLIDRKQGYPGDIFLVQPTKNARKMGKNLALLPGRRRKLFPDGQPHIITQTKEELQ